MVYNVDVFTLDKSSMPIIIVEHQGTMLGYVIKLNVSGAKRNNLLEIKNLLK